MLCRAERGTLRSCVSLVPYKLVVATISFTLHNMQVRMCNVLTATVFAATLLFEGRLYLQAYSLQFVYQCASSHMHEIWFTVSAQCTNGQVRLVGGSGPHEGKVEVCDDHHWAAVQICGDDWDDDDAKVVCRQLGYMPGGKCHIV